MRINHILFRATDLRGMVSFLENVIGLHEGYRPPFRFPGAWVYSGDNALIHLVEASNAQATMGNIDHVAIEGADYNLLMKNLESYSVAYREVEVPETHQKQVFVTGPEGLILEMQFPANDVVTD